jgi:manganese transport protein
LPFAIWPLIRLTSDRALMGGHANRPWIKSVSWMLFVVISVANVWLLIRLTG